MSFAKLLKKLETATAPNFSEVLNRIGNAPTPNKITVDGRPEMIVDAKPIKCDVFTDDFLSLKQRVEKS